LRLTIHHAGTHTLDQALYLFGRPASVTGFFRSNRGVDSAIDDTFTIILQYSGEQKRLLVTVKTAIVTHMKDQLRFLVRGNKGTYLKVGTVDNITHAPPGPPPFPCPPPLSSFLATLTPPPQFGTCPQEAQAHAAPGKAAASPDTGVEDERIWGTLTTTTEFDAKSQRFDEESNKYIGKYPSLPGWYRGYYENVAAAICGKEEVFVKPETSRDGLRIIELARESHEKGCTVAWS
jgi:predicted dehydrogenase